MYTPLWFRILLASPFAFKSMKVLIGVWGRGVRHMSICVKVRGSKSNAPVEAAVTSRYINFIQPVFILSWHYPYPRTKFSHLAWRKTRSDASQIWVISVKSCRRWIRGKNVHMSYWFNQRAIPLFWSYTSTPVRMYHKFQQFQPLPRIKGLSGLRPQEMRMTLCFPSLCKLLIWTLVENQLTMRARMIHVSILIRIVETGSLNIYPS